MSLGDAGPTLIGNPVSPYVRKVLVACVLKGLKPRIDPIVPFMGSDEFTAVSPLRHVPVWIDETVTLCDSTVILEYLDDRYPEPQLRPQGLADRARARWLEEYADTRMGEVFVRRLFFQAVIRPFVWKEATDEAMVDRARNVDAPGIFDYLEQQLPEQGFLFGDLSNADVSIGVYFANARWSRLQPDAARWPRLVAWLEKLDQESPLGELNRAASRILKAHPGDHRALLPALGFEVSEQTWGGSRPRPGVMGS